MSTYQIVALGIVCTAVIWDLATRRIPNVLTLGTALAAVVLHGWIGGGPGLGTALAGWAVGAALLFPVFALRGMGAGDVKLLAAVGAWLGPEAALWVALYTGVAGGILALTVAAYAGYLRTAFANIWGLLAYWRLVGIQPAPALMLPTHTGPRLAYAVPVLAGLMVTIWLR